MTLRSFRGATAADFASILASLDEQFVGFDVEDLGKSGDGRQLEVLALGLDSAEPLDCAVQLRGQLFLSPSRRSSEFGYSSPYLRGEGVGIVGGGHPASVVGLASLNKN